MGIRVRVRVRVRGRVRNTFVMKLWPAKEDMLYSPDGATVPSVQGEARTCE